MKDLCPKCKRPGTVTIVESFIMGKPGSIESEMIRCEPCDLQKDGDRWINPYEELKKIDDRYRAEQN